LAETRKKIFGKKLLKWWQSNKESYPWRKTKNPYSILVAELLLRKTTSKQVKKMYENFIEAYPSPKQLAEASEDDLKKMLTPLGMENIRTQLFMRIAEAVSDNFNGGIPATEKGLRALPGVGKYSANAVLCMAYGRKVPMVDTNAVRIIRRVFSFKSSKGREKDDVALWKLAKELIPENRARKFNLALIDFGHLICLPKNPLCRSCPLRKICDYGITQIG
jgi:A/G-specific adenine glycosylase